MYNIYFENISFVLQKIQVDFLCSLQSRIEKSIFSVRLKQRVIFDRFYNFALPASDRFFSDFGSSIRFSAIGKLRPGDWVGIRFMVHRTG
jgi:hypothetical protein